MSVLIKDITDAEFEAEVLKSEVPVVVDFWAPWCGPCKMMAPALEALAEKYQGKLKIVKINVDEHKEQARLAGVRGIPYLLHVVEGQVVSKQIGAVSGAGLETWLKLH